MVRLKDLTGKVFGELTVMSMLEDRNKGGKAQWDCVCSCGNKRVVNTSSLTSGRCTKCEECCSKEGYHKTYKNREKALFINVYNRLKQRHKKKGGSKDSIISFERFKELSSMPCVYCGVKYSRVIADRSSDTEINLVGIDRIDSSKGYIEGNVVSCCGFCNRLKMEYAAHGFYAWLKRVTEHQTPYIVNGRL